MDGAKVFLMTKIPILSYHYEFFDTEIMISRRMRKGIIMNFQGDLEGNNL